MNYDQCPFCCPWRQQSQPVAGQQPVMQPQGPPACPQGFVYTVVAGDTMFLISRRFGVSLDALVAANPQITDPARIVPGMQICVPRQQPPIPPPPMCTGGTLYTVQTGDTLLGIATRFGLTLNSLLQVNPQITNPDFIIVGQQICIPIPIPQPVPCPGGFIYIVQRGDTLSQIAARFALTAQDILRVNPQITNPNQLFIGQQICIPLPIPQPPACSGTLYTIRAGDTLNSIARQYNLTVEVLLRANPQITNPNLIFTGQQICIPMRTDREEPQNEEVRGEEQVEEE